MSEEAQEAQDPSPENAEEAQQTDGAEQPGTEEEQAKAKGEEADNTESQQANQGEGEAIPEESKGIIGDQLFQNTSALIGALTGEDDEDNGENNGEQKEQQEGAQEGEGQEGNNEDNGENEENQDQDFQVQENESYETPYETEPHYQEIQQPKKPQSNAQSPRRAPRSPRQTRQRTAPPPEEDLAALSKKFLAGEKVTETDPDILACVVRDLEDRRDQMMLEGSFFQSLKAQQAVDNAKKQQLDACKKSAQTDRQNDLSQRKESAQQEYNEFNQQMKERENEMNQRLDEQVKELKDRHQREMQEHDAEWQSETKARQFNRSSQRLRILRTQQQLLMNAKRFDEAAQVCRIADGVAAAETAESHHQMLTAYNQSKTLLLHKQEEEMDTLNKACEVKRGEFKYMKDTLTLRFTHRFENLQNEEEVAKDPERFWVLKHRNDGDQVVNSVGTRTSRNTIARSARVEEFNTLPLPPLPIASSPRNTKRNNEQLNQTA